MPSLPPYRVLSCQFQGPLHLAGSDSSCCLTAAASCCTSLSSSALHRLLGPTPAGAFIESLSNVMRSCMATLNAAMSLRMTFLLSSWRSAPYASANLPGANTAVVLTTSSNFTTMSMNLSAPRAHLRSQHLARFNRLRRAGRGRARAPASDASAAQPHSSLLPRSLGSVSANAATARPDAAPVAVASAPSTASAPTVNTDRLGARCSATQARIGRHRRCGRSCCKPVRDPPHGHPQSVPVPADIQRQQNHHMQPRFRHVALQGHRRYGHWCAASVPSMC
jgi:hypothetical protein